jgi:hypothetical protein
MLEKGNNQVEIMYLSTSSGKIRFRYDGGEEIGTISKVTLDLRRIICHRNNLWYGQNE